MEIRSKKNTRPTDGLKSIAIMTAAGTVTNQTRYMGPALEALVYQDVASTTFDNLAWFILQKS